MKKNTLAEKIAAALQKLGPSSPRQLLDAVGGSEKKLGYRLRRMRFAGELKARGTSSDRVYYLPAQRSPSAAAAAAAKAARGSTLDTVITLQEPLAARLPDGRIVLVHADGPAIPTIIAADFVAPLAELLKAA